MPFKRLFQKIDGRALGPETYSGLIGRQLKDCETKPIDSFARIDLGYSLPITNREDLSEVGSTIEAYGVANAYAHVNAPE